LPDIHDVQAPREEKPRQKARPRSRGLAAPPWSGWRLSSAGLFRSGSRSARFRGNGNSYRKGASAGLIIPTLDLASVRAHDPVTDAQAKPGAFARLLCGVERIENALGVNNALAVVGDRDLDCLTAVMSANSDHSPALRLLDGVVGVIQDVEEYLL